MTALAAEHGLGSWLLFAPFHHSWALAKQGYDAEAVPTMKAILATAHAAGADIGRSHRLCMLAEVYQDLGRLDDALSTVTEALAAEEAQDERYYAPEVRRLKGELLLKQTPSDGKQARSYFERAIEIARSQSAKSFELRATTSLARLFASQGRRDEACTMLAEIYAWFTEGFDTADLKDAKALLETLSIEAS